MGTAAQSAKLETMFTSVVIAAVILTYTCSPATGQKRPQGQPQPNGCLWGGRGYPNNVMWDCNDAQQYDPRFEQCNKCWCQNGLPTGTRARCRQITIGPWDGKLKPAK